MLIFTSLQRIIVKSELFTSVAVRVRKIIPVTSVRTPWEPSQQGYDGVVWRAAGNSQAPVFHARQFTRYFYYNHPYIFIIISQIITISRYCCRYIYFTIILWQFIGNRFCSYLLVFVSFESFNFELRYLVI